MSYTSPLTVIADGTRPNPLVAPSFPADSERPRLEPGEQVVHVVDHGHVTLEIRDGGGGWESAWSPPKHASVVVTDRRVVVGCRTFDRGSTYVGFGGIGALVALSATAVSRARAKNAIAGQCLAMQWRHEWVSAVAYLCAAPGWQGGLSRLAGVPTERIAIVAEEPRIHWRLVFGSFADPHPWQSATSVAAAVVRARAGAAAELDPAERAAVRRLATNPRFDGGPGASRALQIPGARRIGRPPATSAPVLGPSAVPVLAASAAPMGGPQCCRNPRCEAAEIATPLAICDLCGSSTRAEAPAPRRAPRPQRSPATSAATCPNDACDAFGLRTPLPECDLCGRPTVSA